MAEETTKQKLEDSKMAEETTKQKLEDSKTTVRMAEEATRVAEEITKRAFHTSAVRLAEEATLQAVEMTKQSELQKVAVTTPLPTVIRVSPDELITRNRSWVESGNLGSSVGMRQTIGTRVFVNSANMLNAGDVIISRENELHRVVAAVAAEIPSKIRNTSAQSTLIGDINHWKTLTCNNPQRTLGFKWHTIRQHCTLDINFLRSIPDTEFIGEFSNKMVPKRHNPASQSVETLTKETFKNINELSVYLAVCTTNRKRSIRIRCGIR